MALKSTIYKATLQIADMDRPLYADHALTLALHPSETEERLLVQPYSFYAKCYALPDLHAGKMHALLFRKWKSRVKGRDWFDFEWYVRNAVPLHLAHLEQRARQSGDWDGPAMGRVDFLRLLQQRIDTLDIDQARADVRPFLRDARALEIWSPRYFRDLADKVAYV